MKQNKGVSKEKEGKEGGMERGKEGRRKEGLDRRNK